MAKNNEVKYVIKDSKGRQLSAPNSNDSELWDRVEAMEARGRTGLCVVAYTGKNESINEAYDEAAQEYMFFIEDILKDVLSGVHDRINRENESTVKLPYVIAGVDIDEDKYKDAIWELVKVFYNSSMPYSAISESCFDEQLKESYSPFDYHIFTSEVIENSYQYDNDDFVQAEQKLFNMVNKKLGVEDSTMIVDTEGRFDPDYLEIDTISEHDVLRMGCEYYVVDGIPFVVEYNDNGNNYIFFRNISEAKDYETLVNEYYEDDMDESVMDTVANTVKGVATAASTVIDSVDKLRS